MGSGDSRPRGMSIISLSHLIIVCRGECGRLIDEMVEQKDKINDASSMSAAHSGRRGLLPLEIFCCILCRTQSGDEYRGFAGNLGCGGGEIVPCCECQEFYWGWVQGFVWRREGQEGDG